MSNSATDDSRAPAIKVVDLKKLYRRGLFRERFSALKGVSITVVQGEIFGLLGPNGAGKTTLIKILLGLIRKSGGTAELLSKSAGDRSSRIRVGYLPEDLRIAGHHTGLTALEYYGQLSGVSWPEIKQRRMQLLEDVGLADRATESVKRYSKGMVQRLGLAQALLHTPELLILDEPTDGLDPVGRSHVRNVLNQLKSEGKTIFLNSHILQEVELVCDRVAILDRGELRASGSVSEIAPQRAEGIELELTAVGEENAIRASLGDRETRNWKKNDDGQHLLTLRLSDQPAVDQCIDDLRSAEISIISLVRKKVTLEDAFLSLFEDQPEE